MTRARIILPIEGVSCASCAATVQEALGSAGGAASAAEDPLERERLGREREIGMLTRKFALAAVVAVVSMLGTMLLMSGPSDATLRSVDLLGRALMPLALRLQEAFARVGLIDPHWLTVGLAALTLPGVLWACQQFYRGAWSGLKHRTADMNPLIGVGTGAAYLYSLVATFFPSVYSYRLCDA